MPQVGTGRAVSGRFDAWRLKRLNSETTRSIWDTQESVIAASALKQSALRIARDLLTGIKQNDIPVEKLLASCDVF